MIIVIIILHQYICTTIILTAFATSGEERLERENREDVHQTEEEIRGMKQVLYNMLQTATSHSHYV